MPKKPSSPKKTPSNDEYQLDNGRRICLQALDQCFWTDVLFRNGFLCFTPTRDTIPRLYATVVKEAKERGAASTPYLIDPVLSKAKNQLPPGRLTNPPRWVCVAEFTSGPVGNSEATSSVLTVVWFQQEMALPIDPGVLKQVLAINWDEYALNIFPSYDL